MRWGRHTGLPGFWVTVAHTWRLDVFPVSTGLERHALWGWAWEVTRW